MPFSSGGFSRVYNWVTDKNNSIPITASRMDTEMNGMATGLSTCLLKDGTQTVTADIPFSNHKLTGVASGTLATDAATVGQLQNTTINWVAGGGTADIITATYSPAVTALVDGMELDFRATAANATTTPTFSPNGLTAHTITKSGGSALGIGDIPAALFEGKLRYNLANTRWELTNPYGAVFPAVDTTALVKGSSDATKLFRIEVDGNTTGTTRVMTTPDSDFTAVGTTTTQTIANKTLTDSSTFFADDGDATKKFAIQCSSIATGTTRTATIPDKSGTMAMTSDLPTATLVAKGVVNFTGSTGAINFSSGNISGVTRNGPGDYTIAFSPNMGDANYVPNITSYVTGTNSANIIRDILTQSTSQLRVVLGSTAGTTDPTKVFISIFGN